MGGHKNVLQLSHDGGVGDPSIEHDFAAAQITGTLEFYIASSDITRTSAFSLREGAVDKIRIDILGSLIQHYPNDSLTSTAVVPVNDTGNHIKVVFDCSAGINGVYQLYVDTVQIGGDHEMMALSTSLDDFFITNLTAVVYSTYMNAYGNVARDDYTVGDNLTLYTDPLAFRHALARYGTHESHMEFSAYDITKMLFLG